MEAYINWNNGPKGPFLTTLHNVRHKNERPEVFANDYWYKIQVNAEGMFFILSNNKKHRLTFAD